MSLDIWTERSGYSFGTIQEKSLIDLSLPVSYNNGFNDSTNLSFNVISGRLPPGLKIVEDKITGSAFEVPRPTTFEFVVRAKYANQIADRTFFINVEGSDPPQWQTPAGDLAVYNPNQYYVLDNSYIDFQLSATDFDTAAGQTLKFFIPKNGGSLPPGLVLTETGRIVGWIQPALAIPENVGDGSFDTTTYDKVAYDFGYRSTNGYDTYVFDSVIFDYSIPSKLPKKLNRYYEFRVIVTDGDTEVSRTFKIYVVGDDFFRADTIALSAGAGNSVFTADTTYVRSPIWTTPRNLGVRRANNYQTFKLDTYDGLDLGPIVYSLDLVNPKTSGTAYTTSANENRVNKNKIRIKSASAAPTVGHKICLANYVPNANDTVYKIVNVQTVTSTEYVLTVTPFLTIGIPNNTVIDLGTDSVIPTGMSFDPGTAEVFGVVPYQPAITLSYEFTISALRFSDTAETARSRRTFSVDIIGDLDSIITWNTDSNLGTIEANLISSLSISATSTLSNSLLIYVITAGQLPPGLSLNLDGEITGKVNQFGSTPGSGLITFDSNNLILDDSETTIDRSFTFTVEARDVAGYSAISKDFTIHISTPNDRLYSNLLVKPFLKQSQRNLFRSFITDATIFPITSIYRPEDPNFGMQTELKMLVFAGIETKSAAQVVGAISLNHAKKKFTLGNIKKAKAVLPGTNTVVYEVIYIDVIDPLEHDGKYLPQLIRTGYVENGQAITVDQDESYYNGPFTIDNQYWQRPMPLDVSIDRSDIFAGDPYSLHKFPNSISLWRKRIKALGLRDRHYLPLWMRSIQDGQIQELDFIPAVPLCFCKPGTADDILLNIKNKNFDFKQIDYVIDRYIIDSVEGYSADKYLVFKNDRTTVT